MEMRKVEELRELDLIDLEGDKFADPKRDHPELECSFATVEGIEPEGMSVIVYTDIVSFVADKDHLINVLGETKYI